MIENIPQNARNWTIFKNVLGGGGFPQTPMQRLAALLLATCGFAACISKIQTIFKLALPLRNPSYAPEHCNQYKCLDDKLMKEFRTQYRYIAIQYQCRL